MLMNCNATVYTPAAITVPATERNSVQISSLPLLVTASTCSLASLIVCLFLLLLKVGPVLFSVSFPEFCFLLPFSHSKSGICFTGMQCWASLLPSFLSSSYISATFVSESYHFQVSPVHFCFVTVIVFYNYLVFSCHLYYTIV